MPTIFDPAKLEAAGAAALAKVKPNAFVVGGTFDGHKVTGGIEYSRTWKTGWGATAFLRGWYDDKPVLPIEKTGVLAGGEITKKF